MALHLSLFSHLEVSDAAKSFTHRMTPRARRLLVYLLLHRTNSLTREQIAFALWIDSPEKEALDTLRRALHELRHALSIVGASEWILGDRIELRWNSNAAYSLDVQEYEHLLRQATLPALRNAVGLYTGDLLVDWDDDWVLVERERLRQLQLNALRRLSEEHRALGEYTIALDYARQVLTLDPLFEAAARQVMTLLYLNGDRAAALAEYDQLRSVLHDELSVEPMAETQALKLAITRGEALPSTEARLPISSSPLRGDQSLPKLIGRTAELTEIHRLWQDAAVGHGRVAIISGEAGVGKSQLALSLATQIAQQKQIVLIGHCYEFEGTLSYQALVEMLRSAAALIHRVKLMPVHRAALARLVPDVVDDVDHLIPLASTPSDDLRTQLFEAMLQTFLTLANHQPILLLFEDVHWAAESTLDWLTYIAPRVSESRLLVVITYRTNEVSARHALARLERRFAPEGKVAALSLKPLSREAHRELVTHLSGLEEARGIQVADRLFAETEGNPFFLHELTRGLIEAEQIRIDEGHWNGPFVEATASAEVPLPESLRDTIEARTQRLTEMARSFVQAAAVAGRVFSYDLIRRVGSWADELALNALDDLLARGFVREETVRGEFAFAHHLVREAIYAELTAPRQRYWHQRLAEALQATRPDDFETLAYHWAQAGDDQRAGHCFAQAGDRARSLVALNDAAALYQAALQRWPNADPAGRAEVLYKLGQCQWVIMETHQALESFAAARDLFERLNERMRAGDMERLIGRMIWELGDAQAAWPHYRRALAVLEPGGETVELARALSSISQMHMLSSEYDEALAWGERALALAERLGAEDAIVHALNNIGASLTHIADRNPDRGLALLHESQQRAHTLGLPHDVCRAYINLGEGLIGLNRYTEAHANYDEQLTYATRVQARAFMSAASVMLSVVDWVIGHWQAALARHAQIFQVTKGPWEIWASTYFGRVNNDLGRTDIACQDLEGMLARAEKWTEMQTAVPHFGQMARAYIAVGQYAQAEDILQRSFALMDRSPYLHSDCTTALLVACQYYTEHTGSLDVARTCITRLERADRQMRTPETDAALAEARGLMALAEEDPASAIEPLRHAVQQWATISRRYDQMRALNHLGVTLTRQDDQAAGRSVFDQAYGIVEGLAAQLNEAEFKAAFLDSQLVRKIRINLG